MTALNIKRAMKAIGLGDRAGDFLAIIDKMELDRNLEISIAQANRGEVISAEEFERRLDEKFATGRYGRV
jgi:hypothetical protein